MQLWKTILAYNGAPFHGWQIQPGAPTIQGTLAHAIRHITGESVLPQGSGRTDAGVHALAQVASFAIEAPIPPPNFHRALNRALPPSIRILSIEHAPAGFHARHSARRKTYEYRIHPAGSICSPMLSSFVWACPLPLDPVALRRAANHILGTHDFTSFAASDPDLSTRTASMKENEERKKTGEENKSGGPRSGASGLSFQSSSPSCEPSSPRPVPCLTRTIHQSTWHQQEGLLIYRITGSGFLHHMVRNLVGTFAEVGAGRIAADSIPAILDARNRSAAGPTAPASGLFLVEVEY